MSSTQVVGRLALALMVGLWSGVAPPASARPSSSATPVRWTANAITAPPPVRARTASALAPNTIEIENAKPGTNAWDTQRGSHATYPTPLGGIEGYSSEISVAPGELLHLHVSATPAAPYRVEVYRLGWYRGAGGRLMSCLPQCRGSEPGASQPVPAPNPQTGELAAGWPITDTVSVGLNWTSGYFVAKLVLVDGPNAGHAYWVPFIVRAPVGATSAILVQASVNTWQAYNAWGGKSLYTFNSSSSAVPASGSNAAAVVSFDRPFAQGTNTGPFAWEYQLVRYLERQGFDVSYQADTDTDARPASLLSHKLDVVSGHDEYWSPAMRNALEAARGAGVNLAFLGADIGYWQSRYGPGDRSLIEYRSRTLDPAPDPAQKTVPFAQLTPPRPECQLLGIGYHGGGFNPSDPPRSYSVTSAGAAVGWFARTGLVAGARIFDSVGYEWDSVEPGCAVPPVTVLLHFAGLQGARGSPGPADAVTYRDPSGATVISDGSMQLVWALDDFAQTPHQDPRVQALFTSVFDELGGLPPPPGPSTPRLLAPGPGATVWNPRPRLHWTAAADPVAPIARYIVRLDGRTLVVTKQTSLVPAYPLRDGRHIWTVLAIDQSGLQAFAALQRFTVRSVRPKALPRGLRLAVYCPRRCAITVRLRVAGTGLRASSHRASRRGGITTFTVLLPRALIAALHRPGHRRVIVSVVTRSGGELRTVPLSVRY